MKLCQLFTVHSLNKKIEFEYYVFLQLELPPFVGQNSEQMSTAMCGMCYASPENVGK